MYYVWRCREWLAPCLSLEFQKMVRVLPLLFRVTCCVFCRATFRLFDLDETQPESVNFICYHIWFFVIFNVSILLCVFFAYSSYIILFFMLVHFFPTIFFLQHLCPNQKLSPTPCTLIFYFSWRFSKSLLCPGTCKCKFEYNNPPIIYLRFILENFTSAGI